MSIMTQERVPSAPQDPSDRLLGENSRPPSLEDDIVLKGLRKALDDGHISHCDYHLYTDAYLMGYLGEGET